MIIGSTAMGARVLLSPIVVAANGIAGTVTSGFSFSSNGEIIEIDSVLGNSIVGRWWTGPNQAGLGAGYQVRALALGKVGTWSGAAAIDDAWITMDASRAWTVAQSGIGSKLTSADFEIRSLSGGAALSSANNSANAVVSAL